MRTQPRFDDLHQWLRWRVNDLAVVHRTANPGTSMCLIWAHRSTEEQQLAYKAGRSKIDGIRRFSLHNYLPSLAADVWVYTNADPNDRDIYENRPPKSEGMKLQLLQRVFPDRRNRRQTRLRSGWRPASSNACQEHLGTL